MLTLVVLLFALIIICQFVRWDIVLVIPHRVIHMYI